jgi:hypothetical protein
MLLDTEAAVVVLGTGAQPAILQITQAQVEMVEEPAETPHILEQVEEWVVILHRWTYLKDIREVQQNHTYMEQVAVEDLIDLVLLVDILGNSLEVMVATAYFHQLLELDIIGVVEEVVHHGMSPPEEAEV